ncbi:glycosyl hydrolase family 95 catalytic domain-containing protein [Zhouia sp. PK063]|uniref:glycoside hydrolase family 95 protein n=1 Tax=Zhouia sp. PK063 TaxID=3373602 RepID=UPI003790ED92
MNKPSEKIMITQILTKYILIGSLAFSLTLCHAQKNNSLSVWEQQPAKGWMNQAYPLGNGNLGAMIFGGITKEHIQFNEHSLWTGNENDTGAYQAFGDLFINLTYKSNDTLVPQDYKRELLINDALHHISYTKKDIFYQREYFINHPHNVMVFHFTANKNHAYNATLTLKDAHDNKIEAISDENFQLQFHGSLANGLTYSARAIIVQQGGEITIKKDSLLHISKANSFTIYMTAATNFINDASLEWKKGNPEIKTKETLQKALKFSYTALKKEHLKDYHQLFNRVHLNLGNISPNNLKLPTAKRLSASVNTDDPNLQALLFQYGRYLLISSSRKGGLPANLQGIWNNSNNPPWRGDYHSNINVQMNYWPAEPTNLAECEWPYLSFINSIRPVKKRLTQVDFPNTRGWTVRTENNIFGGQSYKWNTTGSAWMSRALWEHYAFTQDKTYLKDFAYPILKEIVQFWNDHLKRRPDGTLVAPMGWSPEHGPVEDGVSYDQEIIYDLFTNYIHAEEILHLDDNYEKHVKNMRAHLLQPKIGSWGQLQEWETDRDDPNDKHRHISHLYALYPGHQISPLTTPKLAEAAETSLKARGDGSTGWAMAWKISFWAHLYNGNHAYKLLKNFMTPVQSGDEHVDYNEGGGIYSNMLCAHPPFQIDGNLGYTAAIAEMLVQSQNNTLHLLPALPDQWKFGEVSGLKARGNFEILNMQWKEGKLVKVSIKSLSGNTCHLVLPNAMKPNFSIPSEGLITHKKYQFSTVKNKIYNFSLIN